MGNSAAELNRLMVGTGLVLTLILISAIAARFPYPKSGGDSAESNRETVASGITNKTEGIPPDGYISMVIVGIDGKPLDSTPPFTALLSSRMNGYEFDLPKASQGRGEDYTITVSPDSYSLTLLPRSSRHNRDGIFYLPISLEEVVVRSEQTIEVQAQVRLGGKLAITFSDTDGEKIPEPLKISALQVSDNRSIRLKTFLPEGKPPAVTDEGLKPGVPHMSTTVFEPGSYRLEITAKGQAPIAIPFQIVPGKIIHITAETEQKR